MKKKFCLKKETKWAPAHSRLFQSKTNYTIEFLIPKNPYFDTLHVKIDQETQE